MKNYLVFSMAALLVGASCNTKQEKAAEGFTGAPGEVKLVTLDPGHFHAALVQKVSYPQVSKDVYVYAPTGFDVDEHLKRIQDSTHVRRIRRLGMKSFIREMITWKNVGREEGERDDPGREQRQEDRIHKEDA